MYARTAKIRPDLRLQLCMTGLYFYFLLIGLFAAAHDVNLEWVIVKGISHFSDNSNTRNESWKSLASHAGVFRGARFSSLPTNACSTENNIPFSLFYLRGK